MKRIVILSVVCVIFGALVYIFYQEDLKNNLPTPKPSFIAHTTFGQKLPAWPTEKELVLLHFFNPDCPCSRFNLKELRRISILYSDIVDIQLIATSETDMELPGKLLVDTERKYASIYGVYSTPQAVLVDTNGTLVYRGNYNRARYCSDKQTAFVEQAILGYLNQNISANLMQKAGKPYGCSLFYH